MIFGDTKLLHVLKKRTENYYGIGPVLDIGIAVITLR